MKLAELELKDDETKFGGTIFCGETFKDFIEDVDEEDAEHCNTVNDFNELLKICGLLPLTKKNYPNVEISDKTIKELFKEKSQ
ncbi:hypothetical protein [Staphylococcus shinii]|uniref:hypothetical protein n=1 Tax=Staphylococcus shinii TaxID=2912228 RepID=UPI003EEE34B9